ncbi:amino acid/amide ABC transporter membrane protein 1, HAAT family [Variovorax sp. HW608]|uniref:branched-chain amino acid ABC transporter permease n=1 Tax=Variovorax sp. HW608 TaxID=1034889 RepID=UPI00081FEBD8|nr:branched-chain amino acid ABC transporter permease [Variovorax sp. HW608]SCK10500.1 amino acid/amide ABC transporter membrane protein 1, HAAT family [Variovorax sp. HW608]
MHDLLQQAFSGLATGGIYAIVALALVMIYQTTHHVNFAQGEMAMFSTYVAWALIEAGVPYWGSFVLTTVFGFVLGAFVERVVVRPMADAPVLALVIVFVGLLVIFNSLAGLLFGHSVQSFPSPFPSRGIAGGLLSAHQLGTLAITMVMLVLLFCFFRFTKAGLAMRAVAQNPESSSLVGIRVGGVLGLGWALASTIGAIAGMLVAPVTFLDPNMMMSVLVYAFAGALLGGISSPGGAVIGGLLVGVLENLAGAFLIGNELKLTLALVLIVTVLTVRPVGLFGQRHVSRV